MFIDKIKKVNLLFVIMCLALSAGAAYSTEAYSNVGNFDPGVIDQTNLMQLKDYERQIRARQEEEKGKEEIEMKKKMRDEVDKLPNKEVSFILNSIKFKGNTIYTEEELMSSVCDKIGTEVTINELINFANTVTDFYQQNGYISTIAYLPPQKVQDGNVEIIIMEGKYGKIDVGGNKWARSHFVKTQYLTDKNIKTDHVLNVHDIQESLREMNASGYMKGSIALQDNEESAEYTDLSLEVKDRFPIDFDFRWDDQGRTGIGLNRAVFFAGMYNLTGHGDHLMSTTTLARRSIGQGVFYSLPIADKETKLNLGYSYSGTKLGDDFKDLNIKGKSHNFFASVSRRLVKTENYKLYGDVALDIRNTKTTIGPDDMDLYKYNTRAVRVNLQNIKDDFYGKWFANIGTSIGIPMMNASDDYHDKALPSNNFVKLNGNLARLQVLPLRSLAILQMSGQWASRSLWPSEKMQFGGISSVRGYEEGYFLKDYGMTASLELRTPVPFLNRILPEKLKFIDDSIRLAAFYDMGWFGDIHADNYGPDYVMSVGGGVILKMTKYLSGNVYLGIPIGDKPDNASSCRVHFTVTSNIL